MNDINGKPLKSEPKGSRIALAFLLATVGLFAILFFNTSQPDETGLSYTDFLQSVERGLIRSVVVSEGAGISGMIAGQNGEKTAFKTVIPYPDPELIPYLKTKGVAIEGKANDGFAQDMLIQVIPLVLFLVIMLIMFRQMQGNGNKAMSFGKSKAKTYAESSKKVTFADVAGQAEAKHELSEVVDFLKNPQKFKKMGARIPKGVLLVGMPGTGKTLLARAVAGEAGVAYFHMSGSDFVEMFVGVGASRVRDLFDQGRKNAPCIIFIDELDAVGRTRGAGYGGGHDEREQTLNQLLVEMDGFDAQEGIILLAATNRPDVLDPALLRPGRFDRQVVVAMPDIKEREDILKIHAKNLPLTETVDLGKVARGTSGSSGADLANLCNEAALFAARNNREKVEMDDFEEARDKVLMGVARSSLVITEEEKRATAFHEAGHAILHYFLDNVDPLHKVTIVPRGRALGLAVSLPLKDSFSKNKSWLYDRIVVSYGGYAAERLVYGETTTGTKNDLEQATAIARRMVCEWGMSPEMGAVSYGQEDEPIFLARDISRRQDYSEDTAMKIDNAVRILLDSAMARAMEIITREKAKLDLLAAELIRRETLVDGDIRTLFGLEPEGVRT